MDLTFSADVVPLHSSSASSSVETVVNQPAYLGDPSAVLCAQPYRAASRNKVQGRRRYSEQAASSASSYSAGEARFATDNLMGILATPSGGLFAVAFPDARKPKPPKRQSDVATSSYRKSYFPRNGVHAKSLVPYHPHAPRNQLPAKPRRAKSAHPRESPMPGSGFHAANPYSSVSRLSYSKKTLNSSGM